MDQHLRINVIPSEISGVLAIAPSVAFDARGTVHTLHSALYDMLGVKFVEDKISVSRLNVLRGFHGDFRTGKLLGCLHGSLQLAVLDARRDSHTYGRHDRFVLDDRDFTQVYVPPGVFNAHLCCSNSCILWYKLTAPYEGPQAQATIAWDSVVWPISEPILSTRDQHGSSLAEVSGLTFPQVGCASGYFNPLHAGHLDYLADASRRCDKLVVIVNNDEQVRLKGRIPFYPEDVRLRIVRSLSMVSQAVLACDADRSVSSTLRQLHGEVLKPTEFYNGGDVLDESQVREADTCRELGIRLVFGVGGAKVASSSDIVKGASHAH